MTTVLIADDHTLLRRGLSEILEQTPDITVGGMAENGERALELLRQGSFDVLVLDIQMPGRGGLEILKEVKRLYPDVNVLMLSMHPVDQYAVRTIKAGALGYLTKERTPYELIEAIRTVAAGRRYIDDRLAQQLALEVGEGRESQPHHRLSDRELKVMLELAKGASVRSIAEQLCLSTNTISTYRARILSKMKMRNSAELAYYAVKQGLLD